MPRSGSFQRMSVSNPLFWGGLGLFFYLTSCLFSGEERVIVLVLAPALLLASFFAWVRPRWTRGLTLGVGVLTVVLFAFALWRSGLSLWAIGFFVAGVCEILESLFFWSDDSEDDILEDAEGEKPRRKRKRIAELLETGDADDLLALVFTRIVKHYGGDLNVMDLREHERVFLLAYDAWGIIGNGGFNYLFERSICGDPHYFETAAAFEKIGCVAAAEAFTKALRLFPDARPPEDVGERLRIYRGGPGTKRGPIDEQFFKANKDIESCLLAYVHAHAEEFVELDRRSPKGLPAKRRKRRRRPADEDEGPNAGDLVAALPHWGRVAFAARCGRQVLPLFAANWPNVSAERVGAVTRALELAERSASAACPVEGLEDTITNAMVTAGAAMSELYGIIERRDDEPLPPDGNAAVLASFAANTVVKAAEAANSSADKSIDLALDAFGFARQAAGDASELVETLWHELVQLERVARRGEWTDQTPVPSDVWDLLE